MLGVSKSEKGFFSGTVFHVLPISVKMWNSPKFKHLQMGGPFCCRNNKTFSHPKTFAFEGALLACKNLLRFEQVFLMKKFCLIVA